MNMEVINVADKFDLFEDHWNPRIIGSLNGQDVKIAKVQGEFVWHDHKDEDELFYIVKGSLDIHFENEIKTINAGEMLIVPRGIQHKPVAKEECWILLFEPNSTKHTGEVSDEMTVTEYQKI